MEGTSESSVTSECPLLAQSGLPDALSQCPLSGVKRTSSTVPGCLFLTPKRTSVEVLQCPLVIHGRHRPTSRIDIRIGAFEAAQYFRTHRPPFLAVWGKNDPFFLPAGAEAVKRDMPHADVRFVDTGHFALETHCDEIASAIREFLVTPSELQKRTAQAR
jgi:pimeloyl-ACP methyl ester carboxylesterase